MNDGGDYQQREAVRRGLQAGEGSCACFGAHASAQDHRVASGVAESAGEARSAFMTPLPIPPGRGSYDHARDSLDRNAAYAVAAYLAQRMSPGHESQHSRR